MRFSCAWLFLFLACVGCGADDAQVASSEGVDEGALVGSACTLTGGTESYDGIEGTYERAVARSGEMRVLTVSQVSADGRRAQYTRRIQKLCVGQGCDEESGSMSMLPDNAAFTNNFAFTPGGATEPNELYYVLGVRRDQGRIAEMCVARVVTARDVRRPFSLVRVPTP